MRWWDANVGINPGSRRGAQAVTDSVTAISTEEAERLTGFDKMRVSRSSPAKRLAGLIAQHRRHHPGNACARTPLAGRVALQRRGSESTACARGKITRPLCGRAAATATIAATRWRACLCGGERRKPPLPAAIEPTSSMAARASKHYLVNIPRNGAACCV